MCAGSFKRPFPGSPWSATPWGFSDSVPGPLLRFRKGDRVSIGVDNVLQEPRYTLARTAGAASKPTITKGYTYIRNGMDALQRNMLD
ncbi:MAG: multicopper oxidase domain-containing protein [Betaproteobacteria bacterium]|nr:multicopper oxidase domain-containing protein [Betaproteobacteria bacterium]